MKAASLSSVCEIIMGQAPSGDTYNYEGKGLPLIAGASDFGSQTPQPSRFTTVPGKISQIGDIILCVRATIGDLNWSDKRYCLGRGVASLRVMPGRADARYMWRAIEAYAAPLSAMGRGATFKQISRADIAGLQLPMPPLGEQKRLAAILDQADSLMRERRHSLALLAKLPQAVFASRFLNCHWPQLTLAELVKEDDRINYGVIQPGEESGTGIPLVRAANVADDDFDTHRLKRIAPDIESSYKRSRLHGDEVLVVCVGVSIGSIAIAPNALAGANIARAVARVRVDNRKADPIYVAHFLRLDRSQNYFSSETRTVAQPTLNIKQLSETPVLVPPLELQKEFAKTITQIEATKDLLQAQLNRLDKLFASLQHRAFSGDLTAKAAGRELAAAG